MRLKRACSYPGCPGEAEQGKYRCAKHRKPKEPKSRPSAAKRGYDANWRKIRGLYLKRHPNCETCGAPGEEVDHIVPLARGGTHQWRNLRTQCKSCHSRKTMNEYRRPDGKIGRRSG